MTKVAEKVKALTGQGQTCITEIGVHGLRLKRFEEVVAKLLKANVEPEYVLLPPPPQEFRNIHDGIDDWLFDRLPASARVVGNHPHPKRARNKEGQLRSMLRAVLNLVPPTESATIVDFGGGSGHLGIPLALLLPHCKIIVVDLNERSIQLLHEKARVVILEIENEIRNNNNTSEKCAEGQGIIERFYSRLGSNSIPESCPSSTTRSTTTSSMDLKCCGSMAGPLGNLFTFFGPVEKFENHPLDVAIALHLCGQATDVCLRKALIGKASSIIVAPCCVGKLSGNAFNPDVFHATGQNEATVSYPQSELFGTILSLNQKGYQIQQDWNALAKAADYSDEKEFRTSRNASRRIAKALLETDRRLFLQGRHGYSTALAKMDPLEVTPKNDILVAWRSEAFGEAKHQKLQQLFGTRDADCENDIRVTKAHLLSPNRRKVDANTDKVVLSDPNKKQKQQLDRNDWTHEEEAEIETSITTFMQNTPDEILIFPTRMGGRKRKLIHFVAEKLSLAHWGHGKKVSEKTVAVAKTRPPRGEELKNPKA